MSLPMPSTGGSTYTPQEIQAMEGPLIALAQASGGDLRKLLYAFFGFLHRRTDFYLVPHEEDIKEGRASMGFKEGDAEKLLLASFRQFPLRRIPSAKQQQQQQQQKLKEKQATLTPPAAATTATSTNPETKTKEDVKSSEAGVDKLNISEKSNVDNGNDKKDTTTSSSTLLNSDDIRYTEEGLQIPIGNGGSTKRYKWTQTIDECTVLLPIPEGTRAKNLSVTIKATSISVRAKPTSAEEKEPTVYLEGDLVQKIQPNESTWSLEGGIMIIILYKGAKTFWETIIKDDEKIDTSLVDSRRNIAEYDDSTQAQIRKIMFDQNQARLGKPTSDDILGQNQIPPIPSNVDEIPPLPPGVEYYDQSTIKKIKDIERQQKKKNDS